MQRDSARHLRNLVECLQVVLGVEKQIDGNRRLFDEPIRELVRELAHVGLTSTFGFRLGITPVY